MPDKPWLSSQHPWMMTVEELQMHVSLRSKDAQTNASRGSAAANLCMMGWTHLPKFSCSIDGFTHFSADGQHLLGHTASEHACATGTTSCVRRDEGKGKLTDGHFSTCKALPRTFVGFKILLGIADTTIMEWSKSMAIRG